MILCEGCRVSFLPQDLLSHLGIKRNAIDIRNSLVVKSLCPTSSRVSSFCSDVTSPQSLPISFPLGSTPLQIEELKDSLMAAAEVFKRRKGRGPLLTLDSSSCDVLGCYVQPKTSVKMPPVEKSVQSAPPPQTGVIVEKALKPAPKYVRVTNGVNVPYTVRM